MLILLPPSEAKTPPAHDDGTRLDLDGLTLPELAPAREQVLEALMTVSGRTDAQQMLKVGATVMPEVEANRGLRDAATAPAHRLYTGVLFDALQPDSLDDHQLARAAGQVLVFTGLFGATGFTDRVPAHRLSMDVTLRPFDEAAGPGHNSAAQRSAAQNPGRLGTFWKERLAGPLSRRIGDQLVVDCRSASYAKAFSPPPEQTLRVNNFTEHDGRRKVVTHFAKHARGQLTRMLLQAESEPTSVDEVAEVASTAWNVEVRPAQGRTPHQLDLINSP